MTRWRSGALPVSLSAARHLCSSDPLPLPLVVQCPRIPRSTPRHRRPSPLPATSSLFPLLSSQCIPHHRPTPMHDGAPVPNPAPMRRSSGPRLRRCGSAPPAACSATFHAYGRRTRPFTTVTGVCDCLFDARMAFDGMPHRGRGRGRPRCSEPVCADDHWKERHLKGFCLWQCSRPVWCCLDFASHHVFVPPWPMLT